MGLLAAYRRLLANRPLTRLLVGEFVSSIGDWLYLVAILIVVYAEAQSPLLLGIVGAARVVPYLVLSVPAGIVADRFDRRLVLLVTDVARGAIMVVLTIATALGAPVLVIVLLAIVATCFSAFFSPTIGAYLPSLVPDERDLAPANSAWATLDNLAYVVGPAIGGIVIALGGLPVAFALNALTFGVIAVVLAGLPRSQPASAPSEASPVATTDDPSALEDAAPDHGPPARSPLRDPAVARAALGIGAISATGSFVFGGLGLLTVVVAVALGSGEAGTGALNAAMGVGGFVGAAVAGVLAIRASLPIAVAAGTAVTALGVALFGLSPSLAMAAAALAVAAAGGLVVDVASTTLFQRVVPDAVRGRVLGAVETAGVAAFMGGSLALPIIGTPERLPAVLAVCAAILVAGAVAGLVLVGATRPPPLDQARIAALELSIFAGVPPSAREEAARRLRDRDVAAGTVVIRQGERPDRFYVVVDGSLEVSIAPRPDAPPEPVRTLGPGDVFGEIGLLRDSPRTATVTAVTAARLLALDRRHFLALVGSAPGLTTRLLDLHRGARRVPR